jgi:hypothetical protein
MTVKWADIKTEIDKALEFFAAQGVKPSLRTLYYRLVSVKALPHTNSAYKTLSRKLVEWRKEGHYDWDFLQDATRIVMGYPDDGTYNEGEIAAFERNIDNQLGEISLDKILSELFDHLEPSFDYGRWATQPNIVEVWVEKEAMAQTLSAWLKDKSVTIRVNRGYSSWTFIYNNVRDLSEIVDRHDKIIILYCGDHDPSGLDIDRFLDEALDYFGIDPEKIEFRRFALTQNQINRYQLPPIEVNEKDPRAGGYVQLYGNRAWELDALLAYAPEDFKVDLRGAVDSYYDGAIAQKVSDRADELGDQAGEILDRAKEQAVEIIREAVKDDAI